MFRGKLADAGLTDVTVDTTTRDMWIESAAHLWNVVTSSHPIGGRLAGGLTEDQRSEARRVLDGMLRERSGGEPGATLHSEVHIGVGRT